MEERKQKEREFHNQLLSDEQDPGARPSNKFYSIARRNKRFIEDWVISRSRNASVLDYGCGDGSCAILVAKHGAFAVGIDISDVAIHNAKQSAARQELDGKAHFLIMDCESLGFPDNTFDLIVIRAILHHLKLDKALSELVRVLKKDGVMICAEGLADNPLIQLYRRMTPAERTEWEIDHLLRVKDLKTIKRYFGKAETRFFHLATLAAVPFRNTPIFRPLLGLLEAVDSVALRVPLVQRLAWQAVLVLERPNKAPSGVPSTASAGSA